MVSQRFLGAILVIFIIGASIFFVFTKFRQDISSVSASPTPTPQGLDFIFNEQSSSSNEQSSSSNKTPPAPKPSELSLAKNKKLAQFPGVLTEESLQSKKAVIQTAKGIIQLKIYPEATMAASNFMILVSYGFYDGLVFHRVEDWVVQGGDPLGNGTGGPGYQFPDEPVTRAYTKGIVAMANAGPNTNGSQFFILKTDYPLEPKYTIFGAVISGMDVVEKITVGDIMQKVVIQNLQ